MANDLRAIGCKGGPAEDVVGMTVGEDQVADWQPGDPAHRFAQRRPNPWTAPGVDDRHRLLANNKADVGNVARVIS
jgi:hypothetical protein